MPRFANVFTRGITLIGATMVAVRRLAHGDPTPAWGSEPTIPAARPQGALPTLKMPAAQGWADGETPVAAPGLRVNAFATDLAHPRWIYVLPNGDVLVAEATQVPPPRPRRAFSRPPLWPSCSAPAPWEKAPIASPCCAMRMETASPRSARCSWRG